jgi:hypothetical protein
MSPIQESQGVLERVNHRHRHRHTDITLGCPFERESDFFDHCIIEKRRREG